MSLGAWALIKTHLEKIGKIEKHIDSVYTNFSARVSKSTLSSLLAAFIHTYMLAFAASSLRKKLNINSSAGLWPRGLDENLDENLDGHLDEKEKFEKMEKC